MSALSADVVLCGVTRQTLDDGASVSAPTDVVSESSRSVVLRLCPRKTPSRAGGVGRAEWWVTGVRGRELSDRPTTRDHGTVRIPPPPRVSLAGVSLRHRSCCVCCRKADAGFGVSIVSRRTFAAAECDHLPPESNARCAPPVAVGGGGARRCETRGTASKLGRDGRGRPSVGCGRTVFDPLRTVTGMNDGPYHIPNDDDVSGAAIHPGATLRGADLSDADLFRASLSRADLSDADLSGADLREADLSRADLRGADLSGATLYGVPVSGLNPRRTDLSEADLRGADLSSANLYGVNLSRADLRGATLYRTDLRETDLSGARSDESEIGDARVSRK